MLKITTIALTNKLRRNQISSNNNEIKDKILLKQLNKTNINKIEFLIFITKLAFQ